MTNQSRRTCLIFLLTLADFLCGADLTSAPANLEFVDCSTKLELFSPPTSLNSPVSVQLSPRLQKVMPIGILDPKKRLQQVSTETLAYLHDLSDQRPRWTVVASGGESIVIVGSNPENAGIAIKVPYAPGELSRLAYASEKDTIQKIVARFGEEGRKLFTEILPNTEIENKAKIPVIKMRYVDGGSLRSQLGQLGHLASFETLADIMWQTAMPLQYLHRLKSAHSDVKSGNYWIQMSRDPISGKTQQKIRLGDLAFSGPFGVNPFASIKALGPTITPNYGRPKKHFRSLFGSQPGYVGSIERDMYAHMVTMQEILLGRGLDEMSHHVVKDRTENYSNFVLTRSPHSIDPRIPESLSTLAWTEFKDTGAFLYALEKAKEYKNPDDFYSKYYGPDILERLPPELAAHLIKTDIALSTRFKNWGGLGLRATSLVAIQRELDNLR